jgi:hypothetical protein
MYEFTFNYIEAQFGSDITKGEADRLAKIIVKELGTEFDDVTFNAVYSTSEDEFDGPSEIRQDIVNWIETHWTEAFEDPSMRFDLDFVAEDNAGQLFAVYSNESAGEINPEDSPEVVDTNFWLDNATGFVGNLSELGKHNVIWNRAWSNSGWGYIDDIHPGLNGEEWRARHCPGSVAEEAFNEEWHNEIYNITGKGYVAGYGYTVVEGRETAIGPVGKTESGEYVLLTRKNWDAMEGEEI